MPAEGDLYQDLFPLLRQCQRHRHSSIEPSSSLTISEILSPVGYVLVVNQVDLKTAKEPGTGKRGVRAVVLGFMGLVSAAMIAGWLLSLCGKESYQLTQGQRSINEPLDLAQSGESEKEQLGGHRGTSSKHVISTSYSCYCYAC